MKDQKQIEEMRKEVVSIHRFFFEDDDYEVLDDYIADMLYNAGYRKRSGWVSVEDRLPEREGIYLIYTIRGHIRLGEFHPYFMGDEPQFDPYTTHWMPLPEPPEKEGETYGREKDKQG